MRVENNNPDYGIPKYVIIAYQARWIQPQVMPCERCKKNLSQDVDHIDGRGGKKNIDNRMYDPYNLIFLCRSCHTNKWWFERKQRAKEIVKSKVRFN